MTIYKTPRNMKQCNRDQPLKHRRKASTSLEIRVRGNAYAGSVVLLNLLDLQGLMFAFMPATVTLISGAGYMLYVSCTHLTADIPQATVPCHTNICRGAPIRLIRTRTWEVFQMQYSNVALARTRTADPATTHIDMRNPQSHLISPLA